MEEDKIQEILASQDRQLQIDAIRMIEQENELAKEKDLKLLNQYLISKNKETYPIKPEKVQEEKKKYTETFNKAIQEEQKEKEFEKIRRQRKINQVLRAYGKEPETKESKKKPEIVLEKNEKSQEKSRTLLVRIEEAIDRIKRLISEEASSQTTTPSHREFMERMKPTTMKEIKHINIDKSKEDKEMEK